MMKVTISPNAVEAMKRISLRVRSSNRYSVQSASALVSALIVEFEPMLTPALISTFSEKLVSPAGRRKALLAAMARVAKTADERQLKRLEAQLQRLEGGREKTEPIAPVDPGDAPDAPSPRGDFT